MTRTTKLGCYVDGAAGHANSRIRVAMLLEAYAWDQEQVGHTERAKYMRETARELRGPMSDDAAEEDQAVIWLDEVAPSESGYWGWQDGDFGCWPLDSDD